MSNERDPQDVAREEILKAIGDTAKATEGFTSKASKAEVLKNLAEAYSFIVAPNNAH